MRDESDGVTGRLGGAGIRLSSISPSPRLPFNVSLLHRVTSERNAHRFHDFCEHRLSFFASSQRRSKTRAHKYAVSKHWQHQTLDVIRDAVDTFFGEGERLRRAKQRQTSAWTNSKIQHLRITRCGNNAHQVVNKRVVNSNRGNAGLQIDDFFRTHHRHNFVEWIHMLAITQNLFLIAKIRMTNPQAQHETIK